MGCKNKSNIKVPYNLILSKGLKIGMGLWKVYGKLLFDLTFI